MKSSRSRQAKGLNREKGAEEGYVFVYEGKDGKHYVFHEERNGLQMTYRKHQLIGRKLEEE